MNESDSIAFSEYVSNMPDVSSLSAIAHHKMPHRFSRLCFTMGQAVLKESKTQSTEIFTKYTSQLRNSGGYSAENGVVLHLLLFPEEDTRRKFGMLEARL